VEEMTGLTITYEIADAITLQTLRESKKAVQADIDSLQDLKNFVKLENYQEHDLKDNLNLMPHLDALIKYYGG
jgi:hypothetical protein